MGSGLRATTAILTILLVPLGCASCSGTGQRSCGFSFERNGSGLPADITARLSGPLTREDLDAIERTSREELQRAFADFHLSISDDRKVTGSRSFAPDSKRTDGMPEAIGP